MTDTNEIDEKKEEKTIPWTDDQKIRLQFGGRTYLLVYDVEEVYGRRRFIVRLPGEGSMRMADFRRAFPFSAMPVAQRPGLNVKFYNIR